MLIIKKINLTRFRNKLNFFLKFSAEQPLALIKHKEVVGVVISWKLFQSLCSIYKKYLFNLKANATTPTNLN